MIFPSWDFFSFFRQLVFSSTWMNLEAVPMSGFTNDAKFVYQMLLWRDLSFISTQIVPQINIVANFICKVLLLRHYD